MDVESGVSREEMSRQSGCGRVHAPRVSVLYARDNDMQGRTIALNSNNERTMPKCQQQRDASFGGASRYTAELVPRCHFPPANQRFLLPLHSMFMAGGWQFAGLAAEVLNIESTSEEALPCKIFASGEELSLDDAQASLGSEPQVLVFRYRNKIYAIDHACPHQTFPLSKGSIYDIEDFGIVLSAGISCPKHGWSFDLHTGNSDRGKYKLGLWEVELRDGQDGEEVWVKKKERKRIG